MANHFRLYGRPLMADEVALGLSVTGVLEGYTEGEAYESRLTINNSVGKCTVEVLQASLPPGARVRIDNITKEVVVKWDAYEEVIDEETLLPNGNFENGDDGSWEYGPGGGGQGWSIGTGPDYDTYDGSFSARFANSKGGSDMNSQVIPAKINDYVRVKAMVQQGASSSGKAGGSVHLYFVDENGNNIQHNPGNNVKSGSNGNWNESVAEGGAPAGTTGVRIGISAYRTKQNHPLWIDAVTWNHKYVLGQLGDDVYNLWIKVTDGENRVAYWSGQIEEIGIFLTSKLYGFYDMESLMESSNFVHWSAQSMMPPLESFGAASSFVSWDIVSSRKEYIAPLEDTFSAASSFVSWDIRLIRKQYDHAEPENLRATSGFVSFNLKQHPVVNQPLDVVLSARSGFVSWSFA